MTEAITLHLPATVLREDWLMKQFYGPLTAGLRKKGVRVEHVLHDRDLAADQVAADGGFHIFDHGRLRHPRILNSGMAYVVPFRYLDPWGIRAFSSASAQVFNPAAFDPEYATPLLTDLRHRTVLARKSRYDQPDQVLPIPQGSIAVFLQSEGHREVDETCYLTMRGMIRALLEMDDPRPIVVKPHPRDIDLDTYDWLARKARKNPRLQVIPGNIHDMLAACQVVVTINSAVAIEAMLHHKPVVLCGQADFHHCAVTVRRGAHLAQGLVQAVTTPWPYDAFLSWLFGQICLDPRRPDLADQTLQRIGNMGYDAGLLGLNAPARTGGI